MRDGDTVKVVVTAGIYSEDVYVIIPCDLWKDPEIADAIKRVIESTWQKSDEK